MNSEPSLASLSPRGVNKSQRLFIELGTALSLQANEQEETLAGELIGMQVGGYLIVRLVDITGDQPAPREDMPLQVKYLCSGEVFGFETQTMLALERPDRLLFLAYPTTVKSFNVRSHERIECFLPVRLHWHETIWPAMIVNINFHGCLCTLDGCPQPAPGACDPIVLELTIAGDATVTIRGEVRSVRVHSAHTDLGIHYGHLDPFAQSALRALIPSLNL